MKLATNPRRFRLPQSPSSTRCRENSSDAQQLGGIAGKGIWLLGAAS